MIKNCNEISRKISDVILKFIPHPSSVVVERLQRAAEITAEDGVLHRNTLSTYLVPRIASDLGLNEYQVSKSLNRLTKSIREDEKNRRVLEKMLGKDYLSDLSTGDLIFYVAWLATDGNVREE